MESTRHRSASADAPDAPEAHDLEPKGSGADLLSIALLVFFVSLLLIVAAMLALPAIVR